jgi:uncharacterized protein (TIGR00255 family)
VSLSGMTGFARAEGRAGAWTWIVEARSVNGRGLETRFRGPPNFEGLERTAREAAQGLFSRGQLTVAVQARQSGGASAVRLNREQLERYLEFCRPFVEANRAVAPALDGLLGLPGVIEAGAEDEDPDARAALEAAITETIAAALADLKAARLAEGTALAHVLAGLVDRIATLTAEAEAQAREQPALLKGRFARRIADLVDVPGSLDERVVQEAAILAGRADVREELDRLVAHVASARDLLAGAAAVGRRLDFLSQEFMREANTLCSKSATTALTAVGLELKAVIDQPREQVQNVE